MKLTSEQQQQWNDQGYLLLKGFFTSEHIDRVNKLVDELWDNRSELGPNYVIDVFVETDEEKRLFFTDAPEEARYLPYKLNDLFLSSELVRETVAGQDLAPILGELLSGFPMICNSLNFEYGSQQDYHFDTFYMPSPTPNKMVASWIALEDTTEENGPLTYYPGSHKIPPYHFSNGSTLIVPEEIAEFSAYIGNEIGTRGLTPETLLAKKGDVLIWHSQLFHGGSKILDTNKTRKSLVTHYFTKEDFPDIEAPLITEHSCYMDRKAQPTGYRFPRAQGQGPTAGESDPQAPATNKSWIRRLFS